MTSPPGRRSTTTRSGGSGTAPGRSCSRNCVRRSHLAARREPTPRVAVMNGRVGQDDAGGRAARLRRGQEDYGPEAAYGRRFLGLMLAVVVTTARCRRRRRGTAPAEAPDEAAVPSAGSGASRWGCLRQVVGAHGLGPAVQALCAGVSAPPPQGGGLAAAAPAGWVVERTFAWLGAFNSFHSRDYERLPENSETQLRIGAIHLLLRRATGLRSKYPYRYKRKPKKALA